MGHKSEKFVKIVGIAVTIIGWGVTLASDWVAEKKMEEKIEEKVNEAMAKREKEKENEEEA